MAVKKRKNSLTRRLHRSLGAGAAIFILFMVLSGITMNHSHDLGLDQQTVSQPLLLDWYGLDKPDNIYSFTADTNWFSFAGSQLYLNGSPVSTIPNGVGAIATDQLLVVAASRELLLLDRSGNLIERVNWQQADSASIEAIGTLADGRVVVRSGQQVWFSADELLNWQQLNDPAAQPNWSSSTPAPESIQQAIIQHYRGDSLNLEKVLLDLHSGRIFGTIGILIYDLLALAVGFLAISGMILWLRGRRNGKRK